MGLDVYVGSFTRYYAGDWETVVQQYARETGVSLQVVRPDPDEQSGPVDPDAIRRTILEWREDLSASLGDNLAEALDWDESPDSPYFTDKPAWDCYLSLVLWAAYAEHPKLERPRDYVEDLRRDPAYAESSDPKFRSGFSQLVRDVEIWLPCDFAFTFRAATATGQEVGWGSSLALHRQLETLNSMTWQASEATLAEWRREGADRDAPLETRARFAFAILHSLAALAVQHRLILKLDY